MVILRRLVTNGWLYVSPGFVLRNGGRVLGEEGGGGGGDTLKLHVAFLRGIFLLGGSNV